MQAFCPHFVDCFFSLNIQLFLHNFLKENLCSHIPQRPEAGKHLLCSTLLFLHYCSAPSYENLLHLDSCFWLYTLYSSLSLLSTKSWSLYPDTNVNIFVTSTLILTPNILTAGVLEFFIYSHLLLHSQLWLCVFVATLWTLLSPRAVLPSISGTRHFATLTHKGGPFNYLY